MRALLLLLGLVAIAGAASACEGLSPGDQIIIGSSSCSLAFILASPTDLYFATAGHCVQVDESVSNPDFGEIGKGAFHFLEPETGSTSDGSPGMDFGLIRIDPALYGDLNPKMCGWDGPVGIYEGEAEGGFVRHYGHGVVLGDNEATRPREGAFLSTDEQAFYWTGAAVLGDSGSGVLDENNKAIGVFTHVLFGVNGVPPADNGGTRLQRGLELAKEAGFPELRLVLMGEDPVAVMRSMGSGNGAGNGNGAGTGTGTGNGTAATPTPTSGTPRPSTSPSTQPTPATGGPAEEGVDPASSDEAPAATASKDTPFLAPTTLALALAAAVALARGRGRKR